MIELFKKQTTFVKILIIAVVVVIVGFIVQQIYKRFIKNSIIRETFEDIKIVIESQCDAGNFLDTSSTGTNKCQPCLFPSAVGGMTANNDMSVCSVCDKNMGALASTVTSSTNQILGVKCNVCQNSTPDPDITVSAGQQCVNLSLTNTSIFTPGNSSYGLVATSGTNNTYKNYSLVLGTTFVSDTYGSGNTLGLADVSGGNYSISGKRTTVVPILGINFVTNSASPNITQITNNSNINNYLNFIFKNAQTSVGILLSKILFGGNYNDASTSPNSAITANTLSTIRFRDNKYAPSNPPPGFNNTEYTLATLSQVPSGNYITQLVFDTFWNCGVPTVSDSPCQLDTASNTTKLNRTVQYSFNPLINNINNVSIFNGGTDPSRALCPYNMYPGIPCSTSNVDCKLQSNNYPVVRKIGPVAVSNGSGGFNYQFTEVYTYNISSPPQGAGKSCTTLGMQTTDTSTNTTYFAGGYYNVDVNNSVYDLKPISSEISSTGNTVTITRSCVITPGNNFIASSNYKPAGLPTTDPLYGKALVYKTVANVLSRSNPVANEFTNYYTSTASAVPIIILSTSNAADTYNSSTNKRNTVINASRNLYEKITSVSNISSPGYSDASNIYPALAQLLTDSGIVSNIANITSILFAPNITPITSTQSSASAGTPITPVSAPSSLMSGSLFGTGISATAKAPSFISVGGVASSVKSLVATTKTTAATGSGYLYKGGSTTAISNNTYSDVNNQTLWNACALDRTTGQIQLAADNLSIFRSYDNGVSWFKAVGSATSVSSYDLVNSNVFSETSFIGLCMSKDGAVQYAITNPGWIYYSFNSGLTWNKYTQITTPAPTYPSGPKPTSYFFTVPQNWSSISCSDDGTKVTVVSRGTNDNGYIFVGTAGLGATGSQASLYPGNVSVPNRASMSLSFVRPQGSLSTLPVATSTPAPTLSASQINSNNTFYTNGTSRNWKSVTVSADGVNQTAIVANTLLAVSNDSGSNWRISGLNVTYNPDNVSDYPDNPPRNWTDVHISRATSNSLYTGTVPTFTSGGNNKYQVAIESTPTSLGSVGTSSGVYYSKDGGITWIALLESTIPTGTTLYSVDIDDTNTAYVSADNGSIYKFRIPA